jgi:hypothetical protein
MAQVGISNSVGHRVFSSAILLCKYNHREYIIYSYKFTLFAMPTPCSLFASFYESSWRS